MAGDADQLKIGLVVDDGLDKPDGVQQYVLAIGNWLQQQGHNVHYLTGQTRRRDIPQLHSLSRNIPVRFNGNNNGSIPIGASPRKLQKLLSREQFDVLHVQMPHHPLMAQWIILAASARTAVIGTFHIAPYNKLVTVGNWLLGIWLRPSLKRFDTIVSVSTAAADFAGQTFRVKTSVLPNVVDYPRFHNAKPLPQYADDKLTILFLGRLEPRKGCKTLLEAIALLCQQDKPLPAFRVVICGKGPLEHSLRQLAKQTGIERLVEFAGFVSEVDKPRYYASADIVVFPSSGGESFGIVLLEAMASGRAAVLAGDNPGYRSVMEPQPELLFSPQDVATLADKLAFYLTNKQARQKVQRWGADYTRSFDVAVVGAKLVKIYRQALRKRRSQ